MSTPLDPRDPPLEHRIARRRADGRRALIGAIIGVLLALAIAGMLWWTLGNLALAAAVGGMLAILLPAPLAALTRGRRRAPAPDASGG